MQCFALEQGEGGTASAQDRRSQPASLLCRAAGCTCLPGGWGSRVRAGWRPQRNRLHHVWVPRISACTRAGPLRRGAPPGRHTDPEPGSPLLLEPQLAPPQPLAVLLIADPGPQWSQGQGRGCCLPNFPLWSLSLLPDDGSVCDQAAALTGPAAAPKLLADPRRSCVHPTPPQPFPGGQHSPQLRCRSGGFVMNRSPGPPHPISLHFSLHLPVTPVQVPSQASLPQPAAVP